MTKLRLATDLVLPLDACTQTFAWIGRKGSGKTYGAGKMVEELLTNQVQTVILDTVGNWYGLRLSADGKSTGYEIPVFGGLRQDLPLLATAGEVVADVVVDSGRSVILDISQFNFSERKRFAADFGTKLWQRKKGESQPSPLHLVIEECQLIVPQFVQKEDTRMVHVYEEIIRLGRNYGIGASMITQRPQSVNKEVLTQAECIMAFQVNGVPERKALKDWLTREGSNIELVNDLPSLAVGTCFLWSPQWLKMFRHVAIGKKWTMDASATPTMGSKSVRRDPKPLDVKDIEARMVSTIEKVKAEDPKELKAVIRRLEVALHKAKSEKPEPTIKEVPVINGTHLERLCEVVQSCNQQSRKLTFALDEITKSLAVLGRSSRPDVSIRVHTPPRGESRAEVEHDRSGTISNNSTDRMSGGERKILTVLAQYRASGRTKVQVAILAGYAHTGGGFNNYLSSLRVKGLIAGLGDTYVITDEGDRVLGPVEPLSSGDHLQQYWLTNRQLAGGEKKILGWLLKIYPESVSKETLGQYTGYEPTGGGFNNYLSKLRTLELIEGRNELKASEVFFT